MKYGILFCGYNSEEYVEESLKPWIKRSDCVVSAVSVPFLEYKDQEPFEDKTTDILRKYLEEDKIEYLVDRPRFIREHEARDLALSYLLEEGVDYIWIVDSDEIYSDKEIADICQYVEKNPTYWYKLALKNFIFSKSTYLEEPFCPPRIFKTKFKDYELDRIYWDNDMVYRNDKWQEVDYKSLPNQQIPKNVAWIDHFSWMNDEIGKRKVKYQESRGWKCSYKWNEKEEKLEFNLDNWDKQPILLS